MTPIIYLTGDATQPVCRPAIIAHVCSDAGKWGRGFVLAVSRRWAGPEAYYREWFAEGSDGGFCLGGYCTAYVGKDLAVANMVAQHGVRSRTNPKPIRYNALSQCLKLIGDDAIRHGGWSVHMPRIGCGLAGGTWAEVEPIILNTLSARDIAVYVYDLPGG